MRNWAYDVRRGREGQHRVEVAGRDLLAARSRPAGRWGWLRLSGCSSCALAARPSRTDELSGIDTQPVAATSTTATAVTRARRGDGSAAARTHRPLSPVVVRVAGVRRADAAAAARSGGISGSGDTTRPVARTTRQGQSEHRTLAQAHPRRPASRRAARCPRPRWTVPNPVPPRVRARAGSARQKRLNTRISSPGLRPTPWSRTVKRDRRAATPDRDHDVATLRRTRSR